MNQRVIFILIIATLSSSGILVGINSFDKNTLSTQTTSSEIISTNDEKDYLIPIKIKQDRTSEVWKLPNDQFVFKTGGESPLRIWDDQTNSWVNSKLTDLGNGDYKVQSGRISTVFSGNSIIHYDMDMINQVAKETPQLMKKQGSTYQKIEPTLQSRNAVLSQIQNSEQVGSYQVSDPINLITVTETYSTIYGNFYIYYVFKDGQPLKHTFRLPNQSSNDTFAFYHIFELGGLDERKFIIEDGQIFDIPTGISTLTKQSMGEALTHVKFVDVNSKLLLGEITALDKNARSWTDFKEIFVNKTGTNLIVEFRYGDWKGAFELDPDTYSSSDPTEDGHIQTAEVSGSACSTTAQTQSKTGTDMQIELTTSSTSGRCSRAYTEWNISSIPNNANVTNTVFKFHIWFVNNAINCSYLEMNTRPSTATIQQIWDDVGDGTTFISNNATCTSTGTQKSLDLGTSADSDVEAQLTYDWWAIGMKANSETRDASTHAMFFNTEEETTANPKPTLEITYELPWTITVDANERDGTTALTNGHVLQANSTASRTITLNSTGHAAFTGLGGNQNFTVKELTNNFVVNKTWNYPAISNIILPINTNMFRVDCSTSGSGNDVLIMVNDTDGHRISNFVTPTCDGNDDITWSVTFVKSGKASTQSSFTSKMVARILDTANFGENADQFTVSETTVPTSYASNTITSNAFDVETAFQTKTLDFKLFLSKIVPSSGTTGNQTIGAEGYIKSGRWYSSNTYSAIAPTTQETTPNVLRAFPFIVGKQINLDRIQFEVTNAVASTSCNIGIYQSGSDLYPTSLVVDGGQKLTNSTGLKTTTVNVTLTANKLYWLAYNCNGNPTVATIPSSSIPNVLGYSGNSGLGTQGTGWTVYRTYASTLPPTYPLGGSVLSNIDVVLIQLRVN